MKRKKLNYEDVSTLFAALMPKMDNAMKRQLHSLFSLVMTTTIITTSFVTAAGAYGNPMIVVKNVVSINGNETLTNVTNAGDVISYQIILTNSAQENLTDVNVTDPMINLVNNTSLILPRNNVTLIGNYTVTQTDLNNNGTAGEGFINNTVNVTYTDWNSQNRTDQASNQTAVIQDPSYEIDKTVTSINGDVTQGNVTNEGDVIWYQITVTNTGNLDLNNVTVTDPLINLVNNTSLIGPGSNVTLIGNYTVTQEDLDNNGNSTGFIINNATVDCDLLDPTNATVSTPIANCTIVKTVTDVAGQGPTGNVTAVGDIISYQIEVNNRGRVNLTNVTVTDPMLDDLLNVTDIGIGNSTIVYGNYIVTQEDINDNGTVGDGFLINNATVASDQLGPKYSTAAVWIERNPGYSIFKAVIDPDPTGDCIINSPGDKVPYVIAVKNEGNVDLTNVTVNDPLISLTGPTGDDNEDGVLNPGETWVYEGTYTLEQEDIDNGYINNNATVTCDQLPEKSSNIDTPVDQNADLSIYKTVTGIDNSGDHIINSPGDVINYLVAVKNNGDVELTGVSVDDPMVALTLTSGDHTDPGVLNPGELWIYTGDYTVTPTDIDTNGGGSGLLSNTATVSCNELPPESSTLELQIINAGNIQTGTNDGNNPPAKVAPKAGFSASVTSGYAPLAVQFTDTSTGSPTSWSWDFNSDGTEDSNAQSPAYTYNSPGTYVAKLTVSNANGSDSTPATINVLQVSNSGGGGSNGGSSHSSGGSIGSANVVSSGTGNSATANTTQPETNTSNIGPSSTPAVEPTPVQTATSTPAKQSKKTPGFEIVFGVTALLGAVYLYRRR